MINLDVMTMAILVGILAALVVLFIYTITRPQKISIQKRLGNSVPGKTQYAYSSKFGKFYKNRMSGVVSESFLGKLAELLGINIPLLDSQISDAGASESISGVEIVLLKFLGIVAFVAGLIVFFATKSIYVIIATLFVFFCLFFLPQEKIKEMCKEKKDAIEKELPRFIQEVYLCINAGANLRDALIEVANVTAGQLGEAFRNAFINAEYAGSWSEELTAMARSLKIESLEDFVTDITIADQKGVNQEETLKKELNHINRVARSKTMGEISALESKLSPLQVLFCLLPMLGIVLLPVLIQVLETM